MGIRVNNFIINIDNSIINRQKITIFESLALLNLEDETYYIVLSNLFDMIDLIELLRAFSGNRLNTKREYNINNKFTAKIAQKNGDITLKIHFNKFSNSLYLDKFDCSSLAAKFSKVIQKCEIIDI